MNNIFQLMDLVEACILENVLGISQYMDEVLAILQDALPTYSIEVRIIDPILVIIFDYQVGVIESCWK